MNIDPFSFAIEVLIVLLCISLLLCFLRVSRGPYPPNRIVAFDLIAIHSVAIIVLFSVRSGAEVLLDAAIVTAVLGFLGTVMFSHYLERTDGSDWERPEDAWTPAPPLEKLGKPNEQ